jgi:hypothetical protein
MTNLIPSTSELIAQLRNDITMLRELLTRCDPDTLELAEIDLCFAETMQTESPDHAQHYARAGIKRLASAQDLPDPFGTGKYNDSLTPQQLESLR